MKLDEVLSTAGKYKRRKRVGRGVGSGRGKTSGRGHKGYGARSGSRSLLGFEGGQNPMLSRIPKRGFSNVRFRKDYQTVNVALLERFEDGARVDGRALEAARLIQDAAKPVKILGNGELKKKLTVVASKFSASAAEKITKAGGSVEQA
ncbi:MAG: 50S ribosomal protein L15 [Phycisphaerae bacterium]|nr:50S ribosomal protein L15 [Phycisphaerae bacterium]